MDINDAEDVALFRYNLIHPLLASIFPDANKQSYMRRIAATERLMPNGERGYVQVGTLREWVTKYNKDGLRGLRPKERNDIGQARSLTEEQKEEIVRLKLESPRRTATGIRRRMIGTGWFPNGAPSESTVQRYLAKATPELKQLRIEDKRAFEMAHANDLWQIDTTHGPFITVEGRKRKVYIVAILDDASRMVVGWNMAFKDDAVSVQLALKQAIKTYGRPRQLYTDNGKPYRNRQLDLICADLGIGLRRAAVYHGSSKGKVERLFGVMKQQWMADINYDDYHSLEALRGSFAAYITTCNNRPHSSLPDGASPLDRFSVDVDLIQRVSDDRLDHAFLHREWRKVGNDGTIHLYTDVYETGRATIGQKVMVRFQPDRSAVYLEESDQLTPIKLVDKLANAHTPRQRVRFTEDEE